MSDVSKLENWRQEDWDTGQDYVALFCKIQVSLFELGLHRLNASVYEFMQPHWIQESFVWQGRG